MAKNIILINHFSDSFQLLNKLGLKKSEFILVFTSSIITVFFEVMGIGMLFPIAEIISENKLETSFFGKKISLKYFEEYLYFYISGFILLIAGIKFIVVLVNSLFIARFWNSVNEKLTLNIFKNILSFGLDEYDKESNATYQNLIVLEIEKYSELIKAQIAFVVEIIISFLILLLVFYYDFRSAAVSMFFFGIGFILFFKISNQFISIWGKKRYYYQDILQNHVKSGLMSYLSIKINGGFNFFLKNTERALSERNKYIKRQKVFQNIPRAFIELNSIVGLFISIFFLYVFLSLTKEEIISFLIILLISLTRLLPSISRIITSLNEISFYSNVTGSIVEYLNYSNKELIKIKLENSIIAEKVSFNYDNKKHIIENLTFVYNTNEILGIFGKSGSGKSTLTKLIMGLLSPTSGKIFYDQIEVKNRSKYDTNSIFGYVEQNVRIFKGTLEQNIILDDHLNERNKDLYSKILKTCELSEFDKNTSNNKFLQEEGLNISGGQKQRIGLARALFKKPNILVLDEFTSSLDDVNRDLLKESLKKIKTEWGIGIILISHDKTFKEFCDKIIDL